MVRGEINAGLLNPVQAFMTKERYALFYYTEEIESIGRDTLDNILSNIKHSNVVLFTNAGVDMHSTEKDYKGLKIKKFRFNDCDKVLSTLNAQKPNVSVSITGSLNKYRLKEIKQLNT